MTVLTAETSQTAPTQFLEAEGIRFAYRRLGKAEGVPLVLLQHFTGTMDMWDPTVVDGLASARPVILFDNAGVSRSSGQTPDSVAAMARHALAFIHALGHEQVDLLGFSLGGFGAQVLAAEHPRPGAEGDPRGHRTGRRRGHRESSPGAAAGTAALAPGAPTLSLLLADG